MTWLTRLHDWWQPTSIGLECGNRQRLICDVASNPDANISVPNANEVSP